MKAAAWRPCVAISLGLSLCVAQGPVLSAPSQPMPSLGIPGLPDGLPDLPSFAGPLIRDQASGLALRGFDPVAYRTEGRAEAGQPDYELTHAGTVWRFASAANREAFRDAPALYQPAFDGFDPAAVADGIAVEGDPGLFAVVGQRLVLFRTEKSRARVLADTTILGKAKDRWEEVRESLLR